MSYQKHVTKDVIHSSEECYSAGYNDGYNAQKRESLIQELRFIGVQLEKIAERPRGI